MYKHDIDFILLTNLYLVKCEFGDKLYTKPELVRRYLNKRINKVLKRRFRLMDHL